MMQQEYWLIWWCRNKAHSLKWLRKHMLMNPVLFEDLINGQVREYLLINPGEGKVMYTDEPNHTCRATERGVLLLREKILYLFGVLIPMLISLASLLISIFI